MLLTATLLIPRRGRVSVAFPGSAPGVPTIRLATSVITPAQIASGSTTPVTGSIAVSNGGTGTLTGLAVGSVTYQQGSGWLTPTWDGANSEVDWSINPTGLTVGSYAASFQVTSTNAEPATITALVVIYDPTPGAFPAPAFGLPSFATHAPGNDNVAGDPYAANAIGYYS